MAKKSLNPYLQYAGLLLSTGAALCLFLSSAKVTILLEAAILVLVAVCCFPGKPASSGSAFSIYTQIAALACELLAFQSFTSTWINSSILARVAELLPISAATLVFSLGILGCIAAFYAFCRLCRYLESLIQEFFCTDQKSSLKGNWYLPISAAAFFLLETQWTTDYWLPGILAASLFLMIAAHCPSIPGFLKKIPLGQKLLCLPSSLGISLFRFDNAALQGVPGVLLGVLALPFVFICTAAFVHTLFSFLKEQKTFADITSAEKIVYAFLLLIVLCLMGFVFLHTDAFYGTAFDYDIIYTSDSPILVKNNAYLALSYGENDLRQPLFALFSMPFMGFPYLIGRIFGASAPIMALLMNCFQIPLLFFANFLLACMMKLSGTKRMLFLLLITCSYPVLLFCLMMEQYIAAYFYLILFLYSLCQGAPKRYALWGAGGTLLTSLILLPTLSQVHPVKTFVKWFQEMLNRGMEFVLLLLAFCRVDIILGVASALVDMNQFTGAKLTWMDKFYQYSAFLKSCLLAPAAEITPNMWGNLSWQLMPAEGIHIAGLVLVLLAVVSAVWNRDKKSSLLAAGWLVFSGIMLFVLGWGTQENGLILYALYFGWVFPVLLFQLAEKLAATCKISWLLPAASMAMTVIFLLANTTSLIQTIQFALTHYPL